LGIFRILDRFNIENSAIEWVEIGTLKKSFVIRSFGIFGAEE
jgi:hypothetical protein